MLKILWICDAPGWAYHNRSKNISELLPDYNHKIIFTCETDTQNIIKSMNEYDMIITWMISFVTKKHAHKTILGLTGGRIQNEALTRILNGFDL